MYRHIILVWHLTKHLRVPILGTQTFQVFFTGTAPSAIQPQQPYEITDANGRLVINSFVTTLATILGATHADGQVTELNLFNFAGNQNPGQINALKAPIILNNVTITAGQGIDILIPPAPATLVVRSKNDYT